MGKEDREGKDVNEGYLIIPGVSISRTLWDGVDHASALFQPWCQDAQVLIDVYQPSLWLFVYQIGYPLSHRMTAASG